MAYSAVTQPRPGALAPARHALGGRGGAQHPGPAELDQHRAGGVVEPVAGDRDRAELVVGPAVAARDGDRGVHGPTLARGPDRSTLEAGPGRAYFTSARSTRHSPIASGSTSQMKPATDQVAPLVAGHRQVVQPASARPGSRSTGSRSSNQRHQRRAEREQPRQHPLVDEEHDDRRRGVQQQRGEREAAEHRERLGDQEADEEVDQPNVQSTRLALERGVQQVADQADDERERDRDQRSGATPGQHLGRITIRSRRGSRRTSPSRCAGSTRW